MFTINATFIIVFVSFIIFILLMKYICYLPLMKVMSEREKFYAKNKETIQKTDGKKQDILRKAMSIISLELKKLQNYEVSDLCEVNLLDVVNEAVKIFEEPMKTKGNKISLVDEIKSDITVWADENKLLSVFNNILKNANESTENDTIEFRLALQSSSILIDVTNHGNPINDKDLTFIFQKGYTTKENGTGIGLYSCKNYLASIKGNLELLVSNNEKTTFRIELPLI